MISIAYLTNVRPPSEALAPRASSDSASRSASAAPSAPGVDTFVPSTPRPQTPQITYNARGT